MRRAPEDGAGQPRAALPVLAIKDEFVRRLEAERLLVVTGETGSGKTTQLPQYAARAFDGVVVCTQVRDVVAITVAHRIAAEFDDGKAPGDNVGYDAGGAAVPGQKIRIVSETVLVSMAQEDGLLSDIAVLIIDDAHERTVAGDVVVGVAKRVLAQRPAGSFRVVVLLAPVDPQPFVDFLAEAPSIVSLLAVAGRAQPLRVGGGDPFPVTVEERPIAEDVDDFDATLVQEVVGALRNHPSGHCLVFVASERQAERAVRLFSKVAEPDWMALPLHDGVTHPEINQVLCIDDKRGTVRLVTFGTAVAEASLTAPGVTLVVDTGLAEEERQHAADSPVAVRELVRISQWSAEQRRRQAGRAAEGHCVRLYTWDRLAASVIEPEIRRATLDTTVLQICGLRCDPFLFDFMERPDGARLRRSTAWLKRHGLITPSGFRLTERGRVISRMPFEVHAGHFVLAAHERYRHGPVAAVLATLFGAAGSAVTELEPEADGKPAPYSDLLRLLDVYREWTSAGAGRPHRRVLEKVRRTVASLQGLFDGAPSGAKVPLGEVVGRCLSEAFPDRIAELVLPSNPAAGIHLLGSGLSGELAGSSALLASSSGLFVAMSLSRTPSGRLVADLAHPVQPDWLSADLSTGVQRQSLDVIECYVRQNVHRRYADHCFRRLREPGGAKAADRRFQFAVPVYDAATATMRVYAPMVDAVDVADICRSEVEATRRRDLERDGATCDCCSGQLEVTLGAGLLVRRLEEVGEACHVCFTDPPVCTDAELLRWVCALARTTPPNVKWYRYEGADGTGGAPRGVVVFHQKQAAVLAQSNCPKTVAVRTERDDVYGAVRVVTDVANLPEVLLRRRLKPLNVRLWRPRAGRCEIQVRNVPPRISEAKLRAVVRPAPSGIAVTPSASHPPCYDAILTFTDGNACEEALKWVRCSPLLNRPYTGPTGTARPIHVEFVKQIETTPAEYDVTFDDPQKADQLWADRRQFPELYVDGYATVSVKHAGRYDLKRHAAAIAGYHGVGFDDEAQPDGACRVTFHIGPPSRCAKAAEALRRVTEPIRYVFDDCEKQAMGLELQGAGAFQRWARELSLHLEEGTAQDRLVGVAIYGEQYHQGQFMAKLAEYHTAFARRFLLVSLAPSAGCLFGPGCPGDRLLRQLDGAGRWHMRFDGGANAVEIVVAPGADSPSEAIERCRAALDGILQRCHQPSGTALHCVFCGRRAGLPFAICGHRHCRACLEQAVHTQAAPFSGRRLTRAEAQRLLGAATVQCPACQTPVAAEDVVAALPKSTLDDVCTALALLHIGATDHPIAPCPVAACHGLVQRDKGYAPCSTCGKTVCPRCGAVDDERHLAVTCDEYRDILEGRFVFDVTGIAAAAEKYARDHWAQYCSASGSIVAVTVNPGLELGCMALQRYCRAVQHLELKDLEHNTLYAWHGTSSAGLPAICNEGFDPRRRSGQACGRGEYFGVTAQISLGYCRGSSHLIVAQLIKCPQMSTHNGFCYVVDNPVDWNQAFCLPVVVVTTGGAHAGSARQSIPWILPEKRPLPPIFGPGARRSKDSEVAAQTTMNLRGGSLRQQLAKLASWR